MESKAVTGTNFLAHETVMVTDIVQDLISLQVENTNGLLLVGGTAAKEGGGGGGISNSSLNWRTPYQARRGARG